MCDKHPKQGDPDFSLRGHAGLLSRENPKEFPGQPRNIVPPCPNRDQEVFLWGLLLVPGTPHQGGVHPDQIPEPCSTGSSRCGGAAALM